MENATKALLIGAGILFSVMILSLLMMGYKQISSYFSEEHQSVVIEQTTKFNAQFENYNQKDLRGTDMISLMNKVIDYNERLSYMDGTNYKRLEITVNLINNNILEQFTYSLPASEEGFTNDTIFSGTKITNVTTTGTPPADEDASRDLDKQLLEITETVSKLIKQDTISESNKIPNITETKLQNLASNISNIFLSITNFNNIGDSIKENEGVTNINDLKDTTEQNIVATRQKRNDLIKEILNIDLGLNNRGVVIEMGKLNTIKTMALKYYQVQQFKRAHFECTEIKYDEETGRILKMNFKVKTEGSNVVFN